jgi:hypothetical protein
MPFIPGRRGALRQFNLIALSTLKRTLGNRSSAPSTCCAGSRLERIAGSNS